MQLMPETALRYGVANVFDPTQNIEGGTHYLKELLDRYSQDLSLALAAYNAGPDRVVQYGGVPPFPETQEYVRRITQRYSQSEIKQQ
jgi:soluble lytic murein transglycosylase-like protein